MTETWASHPARQVFLFSILLLVIVLIGYQDTLLTINAFWLGEVNSEDRYGYLVLACSIYLIYIRKDQLVQVSPRPFWPAALPLLGCAGVWLIGYLVDINLLQIVAIPCMALSAVLFAFGFGYLRHTAIPLSMLFFALPVWEFMWPVLQAMTTSVSEYVLRLVGRPVLVEEFTLHLPGGSFIVDRGCAGLRFLLVSTILSLMYTSMNYLNLRQGSILLLIAVVLSFLANWIRVISVILIGDATQMESSLVEDHANFGWFVYLLVVLVPLFFLSNLFAPNLPASDGSIRSQVNHNSRTVLSGVIFAAVLIGSPPLIANSLLSNNSADTRQVNTPAASSTWREVNTARGGSSRAWTPAYLGADYAVNALYSNAGNRVELHILHYRSQTQDAELINMNNQIADGETWVSVPASDSVKQVEIPGRDESFTLLTEQVANGARRKSVWYWYSMGDYFGTGRLQTKIYQLQSILQGRLDANLIAISADCDRANCENAEEALLRFVQDMLPGIQDAL